MSQITVKPKHPIWIRWAHWINFPVLTLMLLSGVQIYWANDIYTPFISNSFYQALGIDHRLSIGLATHFTFMWIFIVNGMLYVGYLAYSGEWREMVPTPTTFKQAWLVMLHDLGLRKTLPTQGKFNAAQRIAYSSIIVMGALAALSGLAIYKPIQVGFLRELFAGYEGARLVHFLLAVGFVLFFVIHIAQVIRAGWNNFQSMITGAEISEEPHEKK